MRDADQFLEVNDARLRYRVESPDPTIAPTVVLVHGWALDLDMWRPQLAALADEFTVIAMDRRGFGLSSGNPSLGRDAEDIAALLDSLGIDDISIVGMSQGARVALDWARRFAERTRSVVLDGPPRLLPTSAGTEIPIDEYRQLIAAEGMHAFRQRWLQHELMQLRSSDERTQELLRGIVARYPGHDLQAMSPVPAIELAAIDAPTLVLNGEHDTDDRHAAAAELAAVMSNAERRVVAGAGHLCNLDNPETYSLLLREFLRRHADGARPSHSTPSEFEPCSTG
jgi:pimeloyl-ACP methyl ester carboxylesterase